MTQSEYTVYPYRWVILAVFMFINITIQILWICFAPITLPASKFYGVGDLEIGLLSMVFMIAFIPLSLPVAWVIDTFGFYRAVTLGALIMTVAGILRGFLATQYLPVLLCTIALAISQPFFLNSWTKVAARWFPIQERATAVGLASVANLLGTAIGLVATPFLFDLWGLPTVLLVYGGVAALSAVVFILFARETPPTPPCPPELDERALMLDGLKSLVKSKPFWVLMWLFLVGNGTFNGISTWIESIVRPRGFSPAEAGAIGGLLLLGGILGAFILSSLSDRARKRKPFIFLGMIGCIPGLLGLTFGMSLPVLLVSAFVYGFFMVSIAAIGYQYAAELTQPTPEGTSNGMLTLAGQISVVFIFGMEILNNISGSFTLPLLLMTGLVIANVFLVTRLQESTVFSAPAADKPA